jgi:hypothetical protein
MIAAGVQFDLIHVGKCGGKTTADELRHAGFRFAHVHLRRPAITPDRRYVVMVRDPMARFVSAFNWRRHLLQAGLNREVGVTDPAQVWLVKHQAESAFIRLYETASMLAEQFEPLPGHDISPAITMLGLIGHVQQGFCWYLDQMLDEIEPSQLLGVVAQENLGQDMLALFGIRPTLARNSDYPRGSQELSPLARRNLARVLSEEYRALHRLKLLADRAGVYMSVTYSP